MDYIFVIIPKKKVIIHILLFINNIVIKDIIEWLFKRKIFNNFFFKVFIIIGNTNSYEIYDEMWSLMKLVNFWIDFNFSNSFGLVLFS